MRELIKKPIISLELFDPVTNYENSCKLVGYISLIEATRQTYKNLGFKCGLEVHQQLLTDKKLFCNCPAGIYQSKTDYNAEIIRHMRPTLSEMGEYDGTALMEKRTRKTIIYRLKNESTCTYDIDDNPPFKINKDALKIALSISLQLNTSIVGELHIARKQYLDGSIPAGFQRTGILGIEGEIFPGGKRVGIIQISIEEDSCREVSDVGHTRIYRTDRVGMPLIETVTYPELLTPEDAAEATEYIRLLNRSSGKVRTGIGAARQDVNVSIEGGTRVEIKGVAHIKWIPELTHTECFRQKALLEIRKILNIRVVDPENWKLNSLEIDKQLLASHFPDLIKSIPSDYKFLAVNLPQFEGILSFFTQPGRIFADEISERLKVIACIEHPNLIHSEMLVNGMDHEILMQLRRQLNVADGDAQLIIWGEPDDITTALETIEERCQAAFEGIPQETRKAINKGITIFERVLPGPNRMYPDTDTAPISIENSDLEDIRKELPGSIKIDIQILNDFKIPIDCHRFLLIHNLVPIIEQLSKETNFSGKYIGLLFGHKLREISRKSNDDILNHITRLKELILYIHKLKLNQELIKSLLPIISKDLNKNIKDHIEDADIPVSLPTELNRDISEHVSDFKKVAITKTPSNAVMWIMKKMKHRVIGHKQMSKLAEQIKGLCLDV